MGTKAIKKYGVETQIITTVIRTLNKHLISILYEIGISDSTASTSLLNLFIILPTGVDSKNCIVLLSIDASIDECKNLDDLISAFKNAMSANSMNKYCDMPSAVYTPNRSYLLNCVSLFDLSLQSDNQTEVAA